MSNISQINWNPGKLPYGLTTAKLREPHNSIPANPLLAEPMYLSGYIERMGTGTGDIIRLCHDKHLKAPEFIQEEFFRTIIWRLQPEEAREQVTEQDSGEANGEVSGEVTEQATEQATEQVTEQATEQVKRLILIMTNEMSRQQLMDKLVLKHRPSFLYTYIQPATEGEWIEMTIPENPNDPNQQYRLTAKGKALQQLLRRKK
ncbi:MAG: ATP-binding protein [Bacteroidales bacterium]|nr:ATP-binding protein [Bacteroidales bacterium]